MNATDTTERRTPNALFRSTLLVLCTVPVLVFACSDDPTPSDTSDTRDDAGTHLATDTGTPAGDGGSTLPPDAGSTAPDATTAPPDAGVCTLLPNGAACTANEECCSGSCDPATHKCVTGAGACVPLGGECQANVECCHGKRCEADGAGVKRCTDLSFCKPQGEACSQASECCSLSCNGTCQATGSLCKTAGTACDSDLECCSNKCQGTCQSAQTSCSTLGERCSTEGRDGSCCSKLCAKMGDGELRCAPSSTCAARGEICSVDSDCCSGICLDGLCPSQSQLGQKLFVGEPCSTDSECASYACAPNYPGGPRICQFLGGCRPAEEICTEDWQCCGYMELSASRDQCRTALPTPGACREVQGLPGLKRCALQTTDKETGEICRSGETKVHNCCGGEEACRPTVTGVSRCFLDGANPDAGCLPNNTPCRIADQCCSRICAPGTGPDGGTELVCSGCVEAGGACTTHADCCGFRCVDSVCEGGEPSSPDAGVPEPEPCRPLGASCASDEDCCSLYCSAVDGGTGTCLSMMK